MGMAKKRLCIFAHFNSKSDVEDYVIYYLLRLNDFGVDIIFSSASPINECKKERLSFCLNILTRDNRNYDFGSWKDGLGILSSSELSQYDELIIANDSCFGPMVSFESLWKEMDRRPSCDFWGITDCIIYRRYVESYFIVFKKQVFMNEAFWSFWKNLPDFKYKHDVVVQGEQQLTRVLFRAGMRYDTYIRFNYAQRFLYACYYKYKVVSTLFVSSNRKFVRSKLEPIGVQDSTITTQKLQYAMRKLIRLLAPFHFNPLLLIPLFLLKQNPLEPFVKKMLLQKNPLSIKVDKLLSYIEKKRDYPVSLFKRI